MATCPKCFTRYADETVNCEVDGEALVPDAALKAMDRDVVVGEMIGEYRVESKLGEGGFGAVYRAIQPLIGKLVAIKVLSRKLSGDPEMVSRFVAEARAVNHIRSRNIVDIFGFGSLPDGRQYFVMELLDGTTLEEYVRERGRLPAEEAVAIFRGIARALDAAHAAGIVHRDLKPENVFLVRDDGVLMPKLLDFGIAKLMGGATGGHKTRTGVPMGTPYYMSPEQCRGDKIDHKTDVYSFGVLAFQVLTGELPFRGDSFMQIMFAHVSSAPPAPSSAWPRLSPLLDPPILTMLAKSPAERPDTCGAAVEAIANAAASAGHAVGTLPVGTPSFALSATTPAAMGAVFAAPRESPGSTLSAAETATDVGPKSRAPLAALGAVLALVLVGGGLALAMTRKPTAEATEPTASPSSAPAVSAGPTPSSVISAAVEPAAPARVRLTLTSEPKRVAVFLGNRLLGTAPDDEIWLDRSDVELELTLKADGYANDKIKVRPADNVSVSVKLTKKAGGGKPGPGVPALEY